MDPGYLCMLGYMDVFATYSQRLTRIVGWNDAGISGGRGGYGKSGNCSDIAYFIYFLSMDRKHVTVSFVYINILVISVENALCLGQRGINNIVNSHCRSGHHIGPHRPKTAPRILRNGRRIKRVTEFA